MEQTPCFSVVLPHDDADFIRPPGLPGQRRQASLEIMRPPVARDDDGDSV